jgi:hypothetical protein
MIDLPPTTPKDVVSASTAVSELTNRAGPCLFEHVCPFVNAVMNVYDMVDEVIALVKHF